MEHLYSNTLNLKVKNFLKLLLKISEDVTCITKTQKEKALGNNT